MKWVLIAIVGLISIGIAIPVIRNYMKPQFPWQNLIAEEASISSSLDFNPYSDYPPRHRSELGVIFKEFLLRPDSRPHAPFITYSLDLGHRGWAQLPGTYNLISTRGSDFWQADDNLGPVYLERLEIRPGKTSRYEIILDLSFKFENGNYRPEKKRFIIPTSYNGLKFSVPIWNEPEKVKFPASWGIPSSKPHWSDYEIREFAGKYVDLSQYQTLKIDQSGSCSMIEANPK